MFTRFLAVVAACWLAALGSPLAASAPPALSGVEGSTEQAITHVLNRLTFGLRPGDLARVKKEGLETWIDRQLNPSRVADGGMSERLARLSTIGLDSQTLAREIHQPARRERQRLQRENTAAVGTANQDPAMDTSGVPPRSERTRPRNEIVRRDRQIVTDLSEAKVLRAIYSERQLEEVLVDFWFNHFNVFAGKGPTRVWIGEFERDAIRPNVLGNFRTMLEAVAKSPAMLFYLDNWMNVDPSARRSRDGRANDSLRTGPQRPLARRATGLNENYARELMELHTLGVDGGYTQQDVVNVARAFTGWGLGFQDGNRQPALRPFESLRVVPSSVEGRQAQGRPEPRRGTPGGRRRVDEPRERFSGFQFNRGLHDDGEKTVLGQTIKAGGGVEDGRQVLDILVAHPATAHFIAEKLARRFVSDEPPDDLVKRAASKFSATRGDLRETLRAIITSPEFLAPDAYRAKVKTPFEFVVSALRATSGDVQVALPVVRELRELGMPLYLCQPPTGYDDTASTWVSSGALVSRMNFALALGSNRLRGVSIPFESTASLSSVRATLLSNALAGSASPGTLATIEKATTVEQAAALALGSPEFQRK